MSSILKKRWMNKWYLFFGVSIPISLIMFIPISNFDSVTGAEISTMISYSVKCAVPFIYLVIAISSLQIIFPGDLSRWLMKNRKYIGLIFAVAMAWQGLFIFIMSYYFHDYYFSEVYYFRDEIEGSIGYIFLTAMVVTSFNFGKKLVDSKQWRIIHKAGIYFLWAYPFSVYWWSISYYESPLTLDYLFYWIGFFAFLLRIIAWGIQRHPKAPKKYGLNQLLGSVLIFTGLSLSVLSLYWQNNISEFLTTLSWSSLLELWLPFWPFEPFLSLMIIGLGTLIFTKEKAYQIDRKILNQG
mgnify:FL=1